MFAASRQDVAANAFPIATGAMDSGPAAQAARKNGIKKIVEVSLFTGISLFIDYR